MIKRVVFKNKLVITAGRTKNFKCDAVNVFKDGETIQLVFPYNSPFPLVNINDGIAITIKEQEFTRLYQEVTTQYCMLKSLIHEVAISNCSTMIDDTRIYKIITNPDSSNPVPRDGFDMVIQDIGKTGQFYVVKSKHFDIKELD